MSYEHTYVAPEKSQGAIRKMLLAHGASNVAFASDADKELEGLRATIHLDDRAYGVKIVVPLIQRRNAKAQDQEHRRVWRVLYHHIKAIFEAADSGVIDIRELLLPYFVTANGKSLGEIFKIDMPKALEAPKRAFLE